LPRCLYLSATALAYPAVIASADRACLYRAARSTCEAAITYLAGRLS
jgi:hypothetical protein